ncbi:MAG TPA: SRPBCC family protein [Solirubrobacteraceae bacterium]
MKLRNEFTVPAAPERAWEVLLDLERVAPCLPGAQIDGGDGNEFEGQMAIKIGPVTSRYKGTVRIEQADARALRAVMRARARDARGAGTAAATISTALAAVDEGTRVTVETDIQISGPAAQFGRGVMQEVSSKLMARFAACLAEEMGADPEPGTPGTLGANEATPADAASGPGARSGATPLTVDWTAAAIARAPTRPGGYEDTPVGRLPTGPAADAALAAAGTRSARPPRSRRTDDVLDLGEISRAAVLRRAVPVMAVIAAMVGALVGLRARRRARGGK